MYSKKLFLIFIFINLSLCEISENRTVTIATNTDDLMTPIPLVSPPTLSTQSEIMLTTSSSTFINDANTSITFNDFTTESSSEKNVTITTNKNYESEYFFEFDYDNSFEVPLPNKLLEKLNEIDSNDTVASKQIPVNPLPMLVTRTPCECKDGLCACCTGMLVSYFRSKACMNLKYIPEEFAFELRMMMNNYQLYKRKISGRNPPPVCINPARIPFIDVCAKFSDIYFIGRNMHICLEVGAYFDEFELFERNFECMRLGDQGVKLVKPEDGGGLPNKPAGNNADVDDGDDDDEDYDEILRSNRMYKYQLN